MKILITGGAGYIGSILTPSLLIAGHSVTVLDNLMYGQAPLLNCCWRPNFNFVHGDVRNENMLEHLVNENDVIIPLAALVGMPLCDKRPQEALDVNFKHIENIVSFVTDQIVLYPNTNSGYGIGKDGECREEDELNPISHYGRLKCRAELQVRSYCDNFVVLRLATVFGASARMRTDLLVNDFVWRAVKDGFIVLYEENFRRNFIHVIDVANTFRYCIDNFEAVKNNVFNVGLSDANLTKMQLCQRIKKYVPDLDIFTGGQRVDPDKRDYIVSNVKLEATGWRPAMSLDAGIEELIKAYKMMKGNVYGNC